MTLSPPDIEVSFANLLKVSKLSLWPGLLVNLLSGGPSDEIFIGIECLGDGSLPERRTKSGDYFRLPLPSF